MTIPKWGGRRATEALARVKSEGRRKKRPCFLCGQDIDYSLPSTDPDGCTVQHIRSRRDFPHLTWVSSNWAPAHLACNQSAGTGENPTEAGVTSQDW
jgi:5-methylcytosine-specific restriction endonuclease McrA